MKLIATNKLPAVMLGLALCSPVWVMAAAEPAHDEAGHAHDHGRHEADDHHEAHDHTDDGHKAESGHDDHGHDAPADDHGEPDADKAHADHAEHDHAGDADKAEPDHDDHGHDDHAGHADEATGHHGAQGGEDAHGHAHGEEEHANEVQLSQAQRQMLGLVTQVLMPRAVGQVLRAPGEVRVNAYATESVAPRIAAQVVQRQARLGDHVEVGQPLVVLSSVEMAQAQGELVVAHREWQRVRRLGRKVVSESRYLQAQIGYQQARARVMSFGMSAADAEQLLRDGAKRADGRFALLASQSGTVIADDFVVGEIVDAGRELFRITDESVRWIEARLSPDDAAQVAVGNVARVSRGDQVLQGKVAQVHHRLDETTRTRAVRIELPDPKHAVHPGLFVDVSIESGTGTPVMAVPEAAVLRSPDGDWQVFVAAEEPDTFQPVEIRRGDNIGDLVVIAGLAPGTEIVTHGAFFLASELAKGGFDPHNH